MQLSVAEKIEQFKNGLTSYATGQGGFPENYLEVRTILLSQSAFKDEIPRFIKSCRNETDFWDFIKNAYPSYQERRAFLSDSMNPIIDFFEGLEESPVSKLDTDYERLDRIGGGGFGQVYKYRNPLLNHDFAVKFLEPSFRNVTDEDYARFFQEAGILFKLNHPSIIRIYDIGINNQKPFIRMEYFEGSSLNEVLVKIGSIDCKKCLSLIKEVASALEHAHRYVVHRDIKPSNIMVAKPNKFRVIDFGLGIYKERQLESRITSLDKGVAGNTYTAPELIDDPSLIDKRSDIYSVGAVWYELIVGSVPRSINIRTHLEGVNGISEQYVNTVMKCLEDIDNRYSSCADLLVDIERLVGECES
jgi:serine/threonine-protein kinase